MNIKIIEKETKAELETIVNEILKDYGWKVVSIQYSTMCCEGKRIYSAMLIYKEDSYL